ncbi:putative Trafficking protein Mon1 [Trypanosoma vivax]|uniref:FUZ/MON1/HPS1 first Longin domain-containing protein n=1 Tax=Trypanosoma vivax (strain Y486) TaxID=1055687 RepID=G0U5R8_TRYVY|nr:putative Trafficking protein Mon1 [Trypanosoma vivax]CCC51219.1 conserved hypothetical protein [Trypanosoma vivax Y486]
MEQGKDGEVCDVLDLIIFDRAVEQQSNERALGNDGDATLLQPVGAIESGPPAGTTAASSNNHSEDRPADDQQLVDTLQKRSKHVFILTSAGKPIFTRYGDENALSDLFGVFQVLIETGLSRPRPTSVSATGRNVQSKERGEDAGLRCITAGDISMHFHVEGKLYYVLVTRTGESSSCCLRQLRQLHLQLLSFVPNACDILKTCPSYDMRRLVSHADARLLRWLIKRNSNEESYLFRCLAAAPLLVRTRDLLQTLLVKHYRSSFKKRNVNSADGNERSHHLFSFFLFRGRVVCAVGPPDSSAPLHIDDSLLLINFVRCLVRLQPGESWAPLCLPNFNGSGYLWCYCADMSRMVRELSTSVPQEEVTAPEVPDNRGDCGGLLLLQIACSQTAFAPLSEQANSIALSLCPSIASVEEALISHERVPLSLVTKDLRKDRLEQENKLLEKMATLVSAAERHGHRSGSARTDKPDAELLSRSPLFSNTHGLQWFAVVLKASSFLVYSEPSPAMRLSKRVRKQQLRLLVRLRDELELLEAADPVVISNTPELSALVMRPTSGIITPVVQQFVARNDYSGMSVSVSEALSASRRVREVMLLFSPHTPKQQMMMGAVHVIMSIVAREAEFKFKQIQGS